MLLIWFGIVMLPNPVFTFQPRSPDAQRCEESDKRNSSK
jgi:hypothetical protein